MTEKINSLIIDKNSNPEEIIRKFPIRWTINRVSELYYIIDRCKRKGVVCELSLVGDHDYELKVIKGE